MDIKPFATEHFYAQYEFNTPHLLSVSDCESLTVGQLLALAGMTPDDLGQLHLGYTESQGHPLLREAIAALYDGIAPDAVVIPATPIEGIYVALRALLAPGDRVVALQPAYDALINVAEHVAGSVALWPVRPDGNGWRVDLDELDRLLTPPTRLLVVNFPHNPTGFVPDRETFDAIIELTQRRGVRLFCDEMYRGLELFGRTPLPSACERAASAVVLAGLSKSHGLPGLRAGWLIIRDPALRARVLNWKFYTSICPPAPSEFLALAALRAHAAITARNRRLIADNLTLAAPFFARHADRFTWRPPLAGSVALVGLPTDDATAYCHALAQSAGVLLLPSGCLGMADNAVRFGFGRTSFPAALAAYDAHLQAGG